jgi:hypothetical protein
MATADENTTKAQFLHMSGTTATTVPGDWHPLLTRPLYSAVEMAMSEMVVSGGEASAKPQS